MTTNTEALTRLASAVQAFRNWPGLEHAKKLRESREYSELVLAWEDAFAALASAPAQPVAMTDEPDLVPRGMPHPAVVALLKDTAAEAGIPWGDDPKPLAFNFMMRAVNAAHKLGFLAALSAQAAPKVPEAKAQAVPKDFITHRDSWRQALVIARDNAEPASVDGDDRAYWEHEIAAYDRAHAELAAAPQPATSEQRKPLTDDGIARAAAWVRKRRDDYLDQHAEIDPSTGAVEFGRGASGEAKREYVGELDEIIEGIESLGRCNAPPPGWACSRNKGHDGPCAAHGIRSTGGEHE